MRRFIEIKMSKKIGVAHPSWRWQMSGIEPSVDLLDDGGDLWPLMLPCFLFIVCKLQRRVQRSCCETQFDLRIGIAKDLFFVGVFLVVFVFALLDGLMRLVWVNSVEYLMHKVRFEALEDDVWLDFSHQ